MYKRWKWYTFLKRHIVVLYFISSYYFFNFFSYIIQFSSYIAISLLFYHAWHFNNKLIEILFFYIKH